MSEAKNNSVWGRVSQSIDHQRAHTSEARGPQSEVEKRAAQALIDLSIGFKWCAKDRFKGSMLAAYWNENHALTPMQWRQAIALLWPAYEGEIGKKPIG
jgi:hypothetical protein